MTAPMSTRVLGYRTFVNVAGPRAEVMPLVDQQLYGWLREKNWDADRLLEGETVPLAAGVTGTSVYLEGQDGSITHRFESVESTGWTVRLTAHVPGSASRSPWLWVDVDGPTSLASPPRLMKRLLEVLDVRDGASALAPDPVVVGAGDVDDLIARVLDPERRTLAFVAASAGGIPLPAWAGHVRKLTKMCSGIASTSVLDPEATRAFAERIGGDLAVRPWTMRTFLPRVDADNPAEGLRHRYLSMQTITNDPAARLARTLGTRASAAVRDLALPTSAVRIDRELSKRLDDVVVDKLTVVRASVPPQADTATSTGEVTTTSDGSISSNRSTGAATPERASADFAAVLSDAARELLRLDEVDDDAIRQLVGLAAIGRQASAQQAAVRARMDQLQAEVDDLSFQLIYARESLEEERLGHYSTELDRARADDLVRRLRLRLAADGQDAWSELPASDTDLAPLDFAELLEGIATRLSSVVFTGSPDVALSLEVHEPAGRWAVKVWEALCALEDYAKASADGTCTTSVDGYLREPPPGCRGYSAQRHARDESADVHANNKLRRARVFPVPDSVEPEGEAFMGAHFKIAQFSMISPRVHYLDDTARSGKIYVGHIGPHLPTKNTN